MINYISIKLFLKYDKLVRQKSSCHITEMHVYNKDFFKINKKTQTDAFRREIDQEYKQTIQNKNTERANKHMRKDLTSLEIRNAS